MVPVRAFQASCRVGGERLSMSAQHSVRFSDCDRTRVVPLRTSASGQSKAIQTTVRMALQKEAVVGGDAGMLEGATRGNRILLCPVFALPTIHAHTLRRPNTVVYGNSPIGLDRRGGQCWESHGTLPRGRQLVELSDYFDERPATELRSPAKPMSRTSCASLLEQRQRPRRISGAPRCCPATRPCGAVQPMPPPQSTGALGSED